MWRKDKTYVDPVRENVFDALNSWATVWLDKGSGKWRMAYSAKWRPLTLMVAESENGLDWLPLPCPTIQPEGGKIAPNHVFTLPDGSGGGVYLDPEARDGFPFKIFAHQMGKTVYERALQDPKHPWHGIAVKDGRAKAYFAGELTLVSADGLHWEARSDYNWGQPHWHPEPPIFGFWHEREKRHLMTVRPGWGDRRVCLQDTVDFRQWSGPAPLLQPDPLDGLVEFYGMPVFRYGGAYVGLLWVFHCETSEAPSRGYNRGIGPLDTHLTYSFDGRHFQRGLRRPLIPLNPPGEIGGGAIETSFMVETDSELRFYSDASEEQHGRGPKRNASKNPRGGIVIHTLRKDGLNYLRSRGGTARFTSKPLVLFEPRLSVNVLAPQGEAQFQLSDMNGEPLPGFTFGDCEPIAKVDALNLALRWKGKSLDEIVNKPIRLQAKFRNAQLFAVRGKFHFLDASDMALLNDGKPIDLRWFDY